MVQVQKRPSTRTTFPQFDESRSVGPRSAGESVCETTTTELPPQEDELTDSDLQKTNTSTSIPVAIINL